MVGDGSGGRGAGDEGDALFERRLAQLREVFAQKLPARLAEVEAAVDAARREGAAADALESARRLAHTLRGTAGSYGFDTLSGELGRILDLLDAAAADARAASGPDWPEVARALARARASLPRPHGA